MYVYIISRQHGGARIELIFCVWFPYWRLVMMEWGECDITRMMNMSNVNVIFHETGFNVVCAFSNFNKFSLVHSTRLADMSCGLSQMSFDNACSIKIQCKTSPLFSTLLVRTYVEVSPIASRHTRGAQNPYFMILMKYFTIEMLTQSYWIFQNFMSTDRRERALVKDLICFWNIVGCLWLWEWAPHNSNSILNSYRNECGN